MPFQAEIAFSVRLQVVFSAGIFALKSASILVEIRLKNELERAKKTSKIRRFSLYLY